MSSSKGHITRSSLSILLFTFLQVLLMPPLQAHEQRTQRPFIVTDIPKANLQIHIPARPQWHWDVQQRLNAHAVFLSTPALYYPPTSIEIISFPRIRIPEGTLAQVASSSLQSVRTRASAQDPRLIRRMKKVSYGDIIGYEEVLALEAQGQVFEALSFTGMFPSGRPITFFTVTAKGQLEHINPMLNKILSNLKYIPQ